MQLGTHLLFALVATYSALASITDAQQVAAVYHPGKTISKFVSFDGHNSEKVKTVRLCLTLTTPIHEDQPNFDANPCSPMLAGSPSGDFNPSLTISPTTATGTYALYFQAGFDSGLFITYNSPKYFDPITIQIDNPQTFTPPRIKIHDATGAP
jgi:hypothetical protein